MPTFHETAPGVDADDQRPPRASQTPQRGPQYRGATAVMVVAMVLALILVVVLASPGTTRHPAVGDFGPSKAPAVLSLEAVLAGRANPCAPDAHPEEALRSYGRIYIACSDGTSVRP